MKVFLPASKLCMYLRSYVNHSWFHSVSYKKSVIATVILNWPMNEVSQGHLKFRHVYLLKTPSVLLDIWNYWLGTFLKTHNLNGEGN